MKARDIADIIEGFAPLSTQEPWDNAGFCIGSPDTEVKGVLVGFDCTPELIMEAVEKGANMVITHHPLIFKGVRKISPDTFLGSAIILAVKNDVVVYAAHTNADKAVQGVNDLMADRLGLKNRTLLSDEGIGLVGELPEPVDTAEFITFVKRQFGLRSLRTSRPIEGPVRKVALCSGSGGSFIENALAAGADVYISGDISYHNFFTGKGFMLMDIGHYESEIDIVDKFISLLVAELSEKTITFAVLRSSINNNPIYYF